MTKHKFPNIDDVDIPITKENEIPVYKISQGYQHEIIINSVSELCKPHFHKTNDVVFTFLYKNPNKTFTRQQIEDGIGTSFSKPFNTILNELKFTGEFRKIFFPHVSKNAIEFRNPINTNDLIAAGVDQDKLFKRVIDLKAYRNKF
jgi:hypothetical protein